MTTNEPESRSGGSVPHAYRNALFWRWVPAMPKAIPTGFVTLLYALSSAANTAGLLKFQNGATIRLSAITAATRGDEKEVRRYLDAAIAAGVVGVVGARGRGKVTLYALILSPNPDWDAALHALEATKKKRSASRPAPVWPDEKIRDPDPELSEPKNGDPDPELSPESEQKVRGPGPRWTSGTRTPNGSGTRTPNNPGITHEVSHDMADVVALPQPSRAAGADKASPSDTETQQGFARCSVCHEPMMRRPGRDTHAHCARSKPA